MDELTEQFLNLKSTEDLAKFFNLEHGKLIFYLYKVSGDKKYKVFTLSKKSGGIRQITAPSKFLKILQGKINNVLTELYVPKTGTYGFVKNRNIVDNAYQHRQQRFVLNIDLKDFFSSINFGRVRGMLIHHPFNFNTTIATILAQICCYQNGLPQGSPCSPIISNYVCRELDNQLQKLANKNMCIYSRYADDLTFSTSLKKFPEELYQEINKSVGKELLRIITLSGFIINENKTSIRSKIERQIVTGLVVNKFPNINRKYIRQLRAVLHAWNKFGLELAKEEFLKQYPKANKSNPNFHFEDIIAGRISFVGYVKGKNHNVYKRFFFLLKQLYPEARISSSPEEAWRIIDENAPIIFTEGKTDRMIIEAALAKLQADGKYKYLSIRYNQYDHEEDLGSGELIKLCRNEAKIKHHNVKYIFLFDRDEDDIVRQAQPSEQLFKNWGKGVYSFCIPVPENRSESKISIEHYFNDIEIKTQDNNGRRLYLSKEFDKKTGRNLEDKTIVCNSLKKGNHLYIIDSGVFNLDDQNIALPKVDFAKAIYNNNPLFKDFSFDNFTSIFDVILEIIKQPPLI